ncbi:hypothetical protein BGX34_008602 [Mortierella sp. NVP85]|nr:hypothetical protein BGX34_008602 [Mortierella sp. NVP85]
MLSTSVHAQQKFSPIITNQPTSVSIDGRAMFILGGTTPEGLMSRQTFLVDLSTSWSTSSPVYKQLSLGPSQFSSPSALSADKTKWFTLVRGAASTYDIPSDTWSTPVEVPGNIKQTAQRAATDPNTGLIYIPFAFTNTDGTRSSLVADIATNNYKSDGKTYKLAQQDNYASAWNEKLQRLVYLMETGGHIYDPSAGWREFVTKGSFVYSTGGCFVSASGGSKMVFFGGATGTQGMTTGDVYILDVDTQVWKKGSSAPAKDTRTTPACAMSNNQLIVWGGNHLSGETYGAVEHDVLVYDITNDSWTSKYTAPSNPTGSKSHDQSSTDASQSSPNGSRTGLVAGAVGAGLLIGLVAAVVVMCRFRRNKQLRKIQPPRIDHESARVDEKPLAPYKPQDDLFVDVKVAQEDPPTAVKVYSKDSAIDVNACVNANVNVNCDMGVDVKADASADVDADADADTDAGTMADVDSGDKVKAMADADADADTDTDEDSDSDDDAGFDIQNNPSTLISRPRDPVYVPPQYQEKALDDRPPIPLKAQGERRPSFLPNAYDERPPIPPRTYLERTLVPAACDARPPLPPKAPRLNKVASYTPTFVESLVPRRAGTVQEGPLGLHGHPQPPQACYNASVTREIPIETSHLNTKNLNPLQTQLLMDGTVTDVLNLYCELRSTWHPPVVDTVEATIPEDPASQLEIVI